MAEGGFLVKFDGKEIIRCYAVGFDYDDWKYIINETEKKEGLLEDAKSLEELFSI